MRALVWLGPERMAVEERPAPRPGPGEVIVRTAAAGICGSEIEGYLGRMGNRRPPLVMGHEFAGEVVGSGTAVAINPIVGCGHCRYCTAGDRNLCPARHLIGIGAPGGFQELVPVPERCLYELPAGTDMRVGALVEPLANGVHAMRRSGAADADYVVVIGAGTIGLACLQAALLFGAKTVVSVERHPVRRSHALRLGASDAFESLSEAKPGADLVVDAAGAVETRRGAIELLGPAGTACFIGLHEDETSLPWHGIIRGNVRVQGVFAYADRDFQQALDWLAAGRAEIPLTEVRPLDDGPEAFATLARGPVDDVKVFLGPRSAVC